METILSLRFFIFQYGIVYKLNIQGTDTSLTVSTLALKLGFTLFLSRSFVKSCDLITPVYVI